MNFEPGFFYHIYNRGNSSRKVFFNRENYLFFLKKMNENLSPFVSFVSWCLMPNHFHIIVFVQKDKIEIIHSMTDSGNRTKTRTLNYSIGILLRSYTRAIQKQEKFSGSLFQQHTSAKPLIDEIKIEPSYWNTAFGTQINIAEGKGYLETCIEYVHQNPVHSGLVKNAEDWEYSSFRDYLGLREGKLIDYNLILKEGLIEMHGRVHSGHAMTSRHSMTSNPGSSSKTDSTIGISHSMTPSHTMTNTVIIGIGSNIDAENNISQMLDILKNHCKVISVSKMIKTKPIGIEDQPDFTNGAVKIETELNQKELIKLLKRIEDQMGRDRTVPKFGPRCIDLDIAVWNGKIVDQDYYTRDFLQKSVDEIN